MSPSSSCVCLIGSGRMGRIRAQLLYSNPRYNFLCIVGSNRELAEEYGVKLYESFENFAKSEDAEKVSAFVVSNSTSKHKESFENILSMNKTCKVFSEKPIAGTPEEINTCFKLFTQSKSQLCCAFQRRFDDSYIAVKNDLTAGKLGKVNYVRVFFADHPTPNIEFLKTEGCPFMDLTPHDIDYVLWCLKSINSDDKVVKVQASGTSSAPELKEAGVLDNVVVNLEMHSGIMVSMFFSRSCAYGYDQRVEFFGTDGCLEVANQPRTSKRFASKDGVSTDLLKYSFPQRFQQAFCSEIDSFADICSDVTETWAVTEEECCEVQKIAMKAQESNQIGKAVYL